MDALNQISEWLDEGQQEGVVSDFQIRVIDQGGDLKFASADEHGPNFDRTHKLGSINKPGQGMPTEGACADDCWCKTEKSEKKHGAFNAAWGIVKGEYGPNPDRTQGGPQPDCTTCKGKGYLKDYQGGTYRCDKCPKWGHEK